MNLVYGTQVFVGNNPLAIGTAGKPIRVFSVELISDGTASAVILYNGTAATAGNTYAQVNGTASKSAINNYLVGKRFPNGCYLGTDAHTVFATVVFTEEH